MERIDPAPADPPEEEFFLRESQRAGAIGSYRLDLATGAWVSSPVLDSILGIDGGYRRDLTGWLDLVQGRVHSAVDAIARGGAGKPAPDVFLHAAAAEPVPPAHCLVIEDSVAGATAAQRAGMDCLALVRHGDASGHRAVGAVPFASMHDLADLLRMVRG